MREKNGFKEMKLLDQVKFCADNHVSSKAYGIHSYPMIGFDLDKIAELANHRGDHFATLPLVVGKETEHACPKSGQTLVDQVLTEDKF